MRLVQIKNDYIGTGHPLLVMSGPCAMESREHVMRSAETLKNIFSKAGVALVFKASYDKANRSSLEAFRGLGIEEGLRLLEEVKRELGLAVVTDVHSVEEAIAVGEVCDVVQIPAFLCRQTDLLVAAASTQAVVSVKKGQFMAPWDMGNVVEKLRSSGNEKIVLVERGVSFGYNNLVSDMRAIPIMQRFEVPVCFDATHSVQLPGGHGTSSGGQREFVELLACAALASGVDCLFLEAHEDPANAKSDKDSQVPFEALPAMLAKFKRLYEVACEQKRLDSIGMNKRFPFLAATVVTSLILGAGIFGVAAKVLRYTEGDKRHYDALMERSNPTLIDKARRQPYEATQHRVEVRKDLYFVEDGKELKLLLTAEEADLLLEQRFGESQLVERMRGVKCLIQEELFHLLPSGEKISDGSGDKNSVPMQIVRYVEAESGAYCYHTKQFCASDVRMSRYILRGHILDSIALEGKPLMDGIADTLELFLDRGELKFKVGNLKARLSN